MELFVDAGIWIVSGIYKIAALAFKLFLILANGQVVDSDSYKILITNFYVIIGIVMLFVIAFSLLKGMVNPDDQKQGTSLIKKLIINLVTSVLILAVLPTIFTFAYDFQSSVINRNVIGKFFGYGDITNSNNEKIPDNMLNAVGSGANQMVNGVFTAFFNVNMNSEVCKNKAYDKCQEEIKSDALGLVSGSDRKSFAETISSVNKDADFSRYQNFSGSVSNDSIDFNFLLSLIAGLALIVVSVSFCFDMAVRSIKLVFYQIIAPIPILLRIMPDSKMSGTFNKWVQITLTCYFEVYIRILVFYFCLWLIKTMLTSGGLFSGMIANYGFGLGILGQAFIILGIIMFMQQAPKLIGEALGVDSSKMGLGLGKALTAGAFIGGGVTALTRNAVNATGNVKNKWGDKKGLGKAGLIAGGVASAFAGGASGALRAGRAGWNAKSVKDMKNAASTGAVQATNARDARAKHKATYGSGFTEVAGGHIQDFQAGITRWATGGNYTALDEESRLYQTIGSYGKAIKKSSDGFIRSKMYLFSMSNDEGGFSLTDSSGNVQTDSRGKQIKFDKGASLEQIDSVVKTLQASGNIEDAKIAAELNSKMQMRIKNIDMAMREAAITGEYNNFNTNCVTAAADGGIQAQARVELQAISNTYQTMSDEFTKNKNLDGFKQFIKDKEIDLTKENPLDLKNKKEPIDMVKATAVLPDYLDAYAENLNYKIRKEQSAGRGKKDK